MYIKKGIIIKATIQLSGIVFLWCILVAKAQEMEVSGTVRDAQDESSIVCVTVMAEATINGTVTDLQGKYRIKTKKGSCWYSVLLDTKLEK